jgi:DNA-binding GntR family transcriptional regulator
MMTTLDIKDETAMSTGLVAMYTQLRNHIVSGQLRPGEQLGEETLAKQYGVSRTPVREALLRLEQDGLVTRTPQGSFVRVRSPEEILDIYEARIALEGAVAAAAARKHTPFDLATLRDAHERFASSDGGEVASSNRRFHHMLWQAGHNLTLVDLLSRIDSHMARYSETTLVYPGRFASAVSEHEQILAAIEAGDAEEAERLARGHFDEAREVRLNMFAAEDRSPLVSGS